MKSSEIYKIKLCQFVILNVRFSLKIIWNTDYFTEVKWFVLLMIKNTAMPIRYKWKVTC